MLIRARKTRKNGKSPSTYGPHAFSLTTVLDDQSAPMAFRLKGPKVTYTGS